MATLRETFLELADYLEKRAEEKYEESLKEKDKKIDVGPDKARELGRPMLGYEDYDDKHRNLVRLTRGELGAFIYCKRAGDVAHAISIAKDNGFFDRSVFVLGPDCYKAVEELKAAGRPVVLDSNLLYRERDPITGEIEETFVPKVLADAGVTFALQPSPDSSLAERYLNYQAARCVRNGVTRPTALEAITINPAKALGVDHLVGSLEAGKVANVLVLSGDPLSFDTWVDAVYINGIRAYSRDSDVRLKQLLGEEPPEEAEETPPGEKDKAEATDEGKDKAEVTDEGKDKDTQEDKG